MSSASAPYSFCHSSSSLSLSLSISFHPIPWLCLLCKLSKRFISRLLEMSTHQSMSVCPFNFLHFSLLWLACKEIRSVCHPCCVSCLSKRNMFNSRSARVILSHLCWRGDMHMSQPFPTDPRSVMVYYSQQERFKSSELWVALCLHAAEGGTGSLATLPSSHPPTSKTLHIQVFPRAHNGSFQGVFRFKKLYFLFFCQLPFPLTGPHLFCHVLSFPRQACGWKGRRCIMEMIAH